MTLLKLLQKQCDMAVNSLAAGHSAEISYTTNIKFGHYQCNNAMKLAKELKLPPREIAEKIKTLLLDQEKKLGRIYQAIEVAGPGFINVTFSPEYITKTIEQNNLSPNNSGNKSKVVIDFSSPNIAKEMHVGHLRSTIIGDCLARILEYSGYAVLRLNHVGDWGTQFGMLISYLQNNNKLDINKLSLSDLVTAYKASKQEFDNNPEFKKQAQQAVVALQAGDANSKATWEAICEVSRQAYEEIYKILDIKITERGESFYNPMLEGIIKDLEKQNLVKISDGAKCVYPAGFKNREGEALPLIIQKSDGGYNYATTDIAALRHRVQVELAKWIIYVTDSGQSQHFQMVFAVCAMANYYDPQQVRINHVPFGLVLRNDGKKFQTRAGESAKLIDLLNDAINKAKQLLIERGEQLSTQELQNSAQILGINAIKYADLANNRISDYVFDINKMLQFEGNTAAFLCYAYVRVQSIKRKIGINSEQINQYKLDLKTPEEIELGLQLARFPETIDNLLQDLLPNRLCDYLYNLAQLFHVFFHNCRVDGSEQQNSRLLLCEKVAQTLEQGFKLLGLKTLEKM